MKSIRKVSNEELKHSLLSSLEKNNLAIDYIKNEIVRNEDIYKYKEDEETKEILNNLKYIEFTLEFVGHSYEESLKKVGVINAKSLFKRK